VVLQPTASSGTAAHRQQWYCSPQPAVVLQPTTSSGAAAHSQQWYCSPQAPVVLQPKASTGTAAHSQQWYYSPQPTVVLQPTACTGVSGHYSIEVSLWGVNSVFRRRRYWLEDPAALMSRHYWTGCWTSPTAGLDTLREKNVRSQRGIEPRLHDCPACSTVTILTEPLSFQLWQKLQLSRPRRDGTWEGRAVYRSTPP
jgi:hypothetical protein